jgi:hypothetical protein
VYWNHDYPAGVRNIPKRNWIDIDEAGIFVETANCKRGKTYIGVRVREEGPYNHSEKFTITMGISGDPNGDRWLDFERKSGTSVDDFYDFVHRILVSIGRGSHIRRRMFTMDNLLAHKNCAVIQLILSWGHRVCFRAPYYPVDGAIEYVFNTIQCDLTVKLANIVNANDLRNEVYKTVGSIDNFVEYFDNLGMEY